MLNETLNQVQSESIDIHDCDAQLGDTGIAVRDSANCSAAELAKLRFQRMRRRRERAILSGSTARGWVARMV